MKIWHQLVAIAVVSFSLAAQPAHGQSPAAEANWPQWRGPLGTGVAPQGNPPLKWDATTNIQWKVRIPGDGTSTPIVWGNQVFIQTAYPSKNPTAPPPKADKGAKTTPPATEAFQFVLLCLDRNSGKTLWQKVVREEVPHEGYRPFDNSFAAASALTDGQHVFAFFGSRGLACFDLAGNLKWQKDFGKQTTRLGFGEGATPALFGNTIVVPWDHEKEDFIVALDKRTGDELWRQSRDEPTGWSTPLIVAHAGKSQVILGGTNRTRSYDLATGQQIWECEGLTTNVIPTAVAAGDMIYITSGYQGSKLLAIRLGSTGDLTGTKAIVWRVDKETPYVPSPLISGERLYFFGGGNRGILSCHDAVTGKNLFGPTRVDGLPGVYASPVAAAGRVYLMSREGTCVVIKDADKLEILATNVLKESIDASPAIVGKQIFLRGRENLYCIAEK